MGSSFVLAILTSTVASVVDAKVVAPQAGSDFGNGWLKTHSAGSGPFTIKAYTPHEALLLAANPNAPGGAPKLKQVVVRNVPDPAARRLLIDQGDADIARDLGPEQIAGVARRERPQDRDLSLDARRLHPYQLGQHDEQGPGQSCVVGSGAMARRLRRTRQGSAVRTVPGPPDLPAEGLPGRPGRDPLPPRCREGEVDPGEGWPRHGAAYPRRRLQPATLPADRPVPPGQFRQSRHRARPRAGRRDRGLRQGPLPPVRNDAALLGAGLFRRELQRQRLRAQPGQFAGGPPRPRHRSQVASLLLNDRRLGALERVGALVFRSESGADDPFVDEPGILARAHVCGTVDPARKDEVIGVLPRPSSQAEMLARAGSRSSN